MKRILAACGLVLFLVPAAASAADVTYHIFIDGRPLDRRSPSGLSRKGVVFIDVVRAVKAFDGLLVFEKDPRSFLVTIRGRSLRFHLGEAAAKLDDSTITLPGAPFRRAGDPYAPVAAIADLAGAKVSIDARTHVADLKLPSVP
jgi:hypothetical protein